MGFFEMIGRVVLAILLCAIVMIIMLYMYKIGYVKWINYGDYSFSAGMICGIILCVVSWRHK